MSVSLFCDKCQLASDTLSKKAIPLFSSPFCLCLTDLSRSGEADLEEIADDDDDDDVDDSLGALSRLDLETSSHLKWNKIIKKAYFLALLVLLFFVIFLMRLFLFAHFYVI
jgi:hypothetical protein